MSLDLTKDIKKIKITSDPKSYSMFLFGRAKIGKSTFAKNLYGDRALILETEPRGQALVGANVAYVNNWTDFVSALLQLKTNAKLKKRFDVVVVDTVDKLVDFVEQYTEEVFDEQELGEKVDFGKDYKFAKDQFKQYVTSIHGMGYTPIYTGHVKYIDNTIPADQASKDQIGGDVKEVRNGRDVFYQFKKAVPDLPTKYWNPVNNSVDQIVYLSSMLVNGHQQRVLHLRESPQWTAGSTFPKIKPTIKDDTKLYRQTLKDAVNYYDKKDQVKKPQTKKAVPFKDLLMKAKKLGFKLAKAGHADKLKQIVADVFGPDQKLLDATESQRQQVEMAIVKMRKAA